MGGMEVDEENQICEVTKAQKRGNKGGELRREEKMLREMLFQEAEKNDER